MVDLLEQMAEANGAMPAQISLAWVLAQAPWIVPIPGTTKREHLEDNIGAVDLELSDDDLSTIEEALEKIEVVGARYPEELEARTGR